MAFWHRSKLSVTWLFATFLYLYVHSVEDSTLMPIFDQFRFFSFFWGCEKSALIAILKTPCASIFLIFGYDATASSIEHASKCLFVTVLVLVMPTTTTESTSTPTQPPTTAGTCIYNNYIIYSLETEQKTVLNISFMYKNSTIKTRKQDSKDKHWQLSQYCVGQKLTPNSRP